MNITIFKTTLGQMAFLFVLMALGFILAKLKAVPEHSERILSKLENYLFIPALVMGTFINQFTVDKLSSAWKLVVFSFAVLFVFAGISFLCVKFCTKSSYLRKIYLYGLSFSNFSFMGNAVVSALFPDFFLEYVIFTMPLWIMIYLWGVPALLLADDSGAHVSLKQRMKSFLNPMFICMLVGMAIGLLSIRIPAFLENAVTTCGNCMSPVAMILSGMTLASIDLKKVLRDGSIYAVSGLRLLVYPLLFIGVAALVPMPPAFVICAVASLAMPLGLNTIVIPSAYGKDTTAAAGMALVSHVLSCITIPLIFILLDLVIR